MITISDDFSVEGKCWWCVTKKSAKDLSSPWMFFICFCSLVKHVQKGITQWWGEAPTQHISAFPIQNTKLLHWLKKGQAEEENLNVFSNNDSFVKEISSFCNRVCSSKTGILMLNHATPPYIWWQPSKIFIRQPKSSAQSQLFTFSSCHAQLFSLYCWLCFTCCR